MALSAASAAWAANDSSGATSGVGGDGFTRWIWYGTDGRVIIQKVNATLGASTQVIVGPVPTWFPVAYCVTNSNDSYVLWRNTTGLASIWRLDVNLAFVSANLYQGPQVQGWEAYGLSCDTVAASTQRLLWKNTNGQVAIWIINRDLTVGSQAAFTQPFGWYGGSQVEDAASVANNNKAIKAMEHLTGQDLSQ